MEHQKCYNNNIIISKHQIQKKFMLSSIDLINIKKVNFNNSKLHHKQPNRQTFYLLDDILAYIDHKYGNLENFQKIIQHKKQLMENIKEKKELIKAQRENEIKKLFADNKLEFKYIGECYMYINYGYPSLESVISNEIKKNNEINNRRMKLSSKLEKIGIELDETMKSCYEYIYNIGTHKSTNDIIRNIEIEHFLVHHTNYSKLIKIYDYDKAKEQAIRQYYHDIKSEGQSGKNKHHNNKLSESIDSDYQDKLTVSFQ